jgi:hypothetical protein
MRKTNCLLFVPHNPKFFNFTKTKGGDISLLTLEEKIKRDPTQRERLRCEAKFSGGARPKKKKFNRGRSVQGRGSSPSIVSEAASGHVSPQDLNLDQFDDDKILYLKNMTDTDIILDFSQGKPVELDEEKKPIYKPKIIKRFLPIWELTEEELNSPVLEGYYRKKMITGVTEAQYHREMAEIQGKEEIEASEMERRRARAARDRVANPHRERGSLRKIGSGGVEMNIIGEDSVDDITGLSQTAQTADGTTISFDLGPKAGTVNPSSERTEMEGLADLISPSEDVVPPGGVSSNDMSTMFSVGEFEVGKT